MTVTYDRETDTVTITLRDAPIRESDEIKPGVIVDLDAEGRVVGVEILDASRTVDNAREMKFTVND